MSYIGQLDKNSYVIATGGGLKAQSQNSRMKIAVQKGFIFRGITSTSAASFNALAWIEQPGIAGIEKAEMIWHTYLTSASKIYRPRQAYEEFCELAARLKKNRPHSPFHAHSGGLGEATRDCFIQVWRVAQAFWTLGVKIPVAVNHFRRNINILSRMESSSETVRLEKRPPHAESFDWSSITPFLDLSPFLTTLKPLFDYEKIIKSPINWNILAARERDMRRTIFSNRDFSNFDAMPPEQRSEAFETVFNYTVASAALRNYFSHVLIRGEWYVDGGIVDPLPFREAFASGCKTIFVFWNPHRIARHKTVHVANNLKDVAEGIVLSDIYTSLYNHAKEKMYSAWREAKIRHVDFFITRPKSWHPDIDFLKISPEAMKYQDKDGTEVMEELFENPDRYNLRLMDRNRLEEYLENEI